VLATGLVVVLAGVLALYAGGATWLANRVLRAAVAPFPGTTLRVRSVSGNLVTRIVAHDLKLERGPVGVPLHVDEVQARYSLAELLQHDIAIREVSVAGPTASLIQLRDSSWNFLPPFPKRAPQANAPSSAPGRSVRIGTVSVSRGQVTVRFLRGPAGSTLRVDDLEFRARDIRIGGGVELRLDTLGFRALPPGPSPQWINVAAAGALAGGRVELTRLDLRSPSSNVSAHGKAAFPVSDWRHPRDFNLSLTARPLSYRDLRALGPRFARDEDVTLDLQAQGSSNRVAVNLDATSSSGGTLVVKSHTTPPGETPIDYDLHGRARGLDPGLLTGGAERTGSLNADFDAALTGQSLDHVNGTVRASFTGSRYGSLASRSGLLEARFKDGEATVQSRGDLAGVGFTARGSVRPFDSIPSYHMNGQVRVLAAAQPASLVERLVGPGGLGVRLRLDGRGVNPRQADAKLVAIAVPSGNGRALLDSGRVEASVVGGVAAFRARGGLAGGLVSARGNVGLAPGISYRVDRGEIEGVDLMALFGDTSGSRVNATFSLNGQGVAPSMATADARVQVSRSTIGSHDLDEGRADVRLRSGGVGITGDANVDGAAFALAAEATPFADRREVRVREVRFRNLDLARTAPGLHLSSDLSGTATLKASGRDATSLVLSSRLALDPSRIGDQPLDGGTFEADATRGRVEFRAAVEAQAGSVKLAGTARPFDSLPSIELKEGAFHDLDVGRVLSRPELETRLTGHLDGRASGKKAESMEATALLELDSSTVKDRTIRTGRLHASLADGQLRLTGRVLTDADSLSIDASGEPFRKPPRFQLTGNVNVPALAALLGPTQLDAGGTARVEAEGQLGPRDSLQVAGRLSLQGHYGDIRVDSLEATLALANGMLRVDTLKLRSNVGEVTAQGPVALFPRTATAVSDLRIEGRLADLSPLAPMLKVDTIGVDSGGFSGTVKGPPDGRRVALHASAVGLAVGNSRVGSLDAAVSGEIKGDTALGPGTATVALNGLSRGASLVRSIRLHGDYDGSELDFHGETAFDDQRSTRLAGRWDPGPAQRRVHVDSLELKARERTWALLHPVEITYGDRFSVGDFVLASGKRRIAVDGVLDRRGEQSLHARVDSLPLIGLTEFSSFPTLDGEVNGRFDLVGPAEAAHATGEISIALKPRGKAVGRVAGKIDWDSSGLRLGLGLVPRKGDSLSVRGDLPLALSLAPGDSGTRLVRPIPNGQVSVDASSRAFPLATLEPLLDPNVARDFKGTLSLDVKARGSLDDPRLSGNIGLTGARVRLPQLGTSYDHGEAAIVLDHREIRLSELRLQAGDGRLEAKGTVQLKESPRASGSPAASYDLSASLREFPVIGSKDIRSQLTGDLRLGGTSEAPVLTGSVAAENANFILTARSSTHAASDVTLTAADLRVVERRFGYDAARSEKVRGRRFDAAALRLDIKLGANNWVRRRSDPVTAVELTGDVKIEKEPGQPLQAFGAIKPLPGRSFVELAGRRFNLKGGAVDLNGPLETARLELQTEYRPTSQTTTSGSDVLITADVEADTGKIAVTLGSTPLMDQRDIMSYLMTGGPATTNPTITTGPAQTDPASTGAAMAVNAALGTVAGSAGQKLGLDVVQILQDLQGAQTLVAGKYVSPDLYLGFRQPLVQATASRDTGPETGTDVMEFEVEYAAFRDVLLNLQGAGSEFRVFLRLRSGY
jgi:translocation and assembly module TamB